MARIERTAEAGKLTRRKRMKSNLVSSGTRRSIGIEECKRTGQASRDRKLLWAHPPDPPGDHQPREGECGEDGRDDADAKRHRKAADWPGADEEQHGSRDESRDVGVEDGRERPCKPGIDRR